MKKFNTQELLQLEKMNVNLKKMNYTEILKVCCNYKLKLLSEQAYEDKVEEFEVITNIENSIIDILETFKKV